LASIHGRINILKYLIEEKNFDPNYPSNHGWRPVHLCISNQIGLRAIECLNYLLEQGADFNVKNNDGVYPIVICFVFLFLWIF
jgi:ankyrin repeat protein